MSDANDRCVTVCVLCGEEDSQPTALLTEKGCHGLIQASKLRGAELQISPGQVVHIKCRKLYCRHAQRLPTSTEGNTPMTSPKTRRSVEEKFDYRTKCLFCGTHAKLTNLNKRGYDVQPIQVRTLEFQNSIKSVCKSRGDEWGDVVLGRIEFANDLPAVDAQYHQTCCSNFRSGYMIPKQFQVEGCASEVKRGRPVQLSTEQAFESVLHYFEENENQQLTVNDLTEKMRELCGEDAYSSVYMRRKLLDHFGDSVIISELNGKLNVVTFRSKAHAILHSFYKRKKHGDNDSEKITIIKTASKLILNDIKSLDNVNLKDEYPSALDMSTTNSKNVVPESLQTFLQMIIDSTCSTSDKLVSSLGQAIIQSALPRSIICPLQLGLGVQMHHQFGSKFLIETLHRLGFCSSYQEVQKFESSAALAESQETLLHISDGQFVQFVGDNVDHNTGTLDGYNTFHGMGIIASITPKDDTVRVIQRIHATRDDLIKVGKVNIHFYKQSATNAMENIVFKHLSDFNQTDESEALSKVHFLLKIARPLRPRTPGWSGVMQTVHTGEYPGKSAVLFLPMIDMNPSDLSCIYSTLKFVARLANSVNVTPMVTFDQPLYWKAVTIVQNEETDIDVRRTIVRLGAFHTEMSFLGSIGKLMENTGLSEILATVYAPNAVGHMLSGKAVSRAVRGHFLVCDALEHILLPEALPQLMDNPTEDTFEDRTDDSNNASRNTEGISLPIDRSVDGNSSPKDAVSDMLCKLLDKTISLDDTLQNELLTDLGHPYDVYIRSLQECRTARLWLQYMEMVDILKKFVAAERMGKWKAHLQALTSMLPYFAAAGHNLYLRCSYVYLQQMYALEESHPEVYSAFCKGNHVIRSSDRFWAGLSSDLIIEQVLMRSVKSVGGMTRGRGMSESQRAQWLMSMPACAELNIAMQEFTGKRYESSEQHRESTNARLVRDMKDRSVLTDFLRERNPFVQQPALRNIETGCIADNKVNVDTSKCVGEKVLRAMENHNVVEFSFKRSSQAITLGAKSNLKVDGEEMSVDPQLLFQRLITVSDNTLDATEDIFCHELCAFPAALFDSSGLLREAQKSQLAHAVWEVGDCGSHYVPNGSTMVLDGGSLLQRLTWVNGTSFGSICEHYNQFVRSNYGAAHIVFDGYASGPSTKDTTHDRRSKGQIGARICFNQTTPCRTKKELFLSNKSNKQDFINMLGQHLAADGCTVYFAEGDADLPIVKAAVNLSVETETVVIGEDTDLLVLLCYHADSNNKNLYFKSDSGSKHKNIWDIRKTKEVLGTSACLLPVVHAFSGCDTVSRIFGFGKGAVLKKTLTDTVIRESAEVFLKDSSHLEIEQAGQQIFRRLYNGKQGDDLNKIRYKRFVHKVNTGSSAVQVQSLPPTQSAAKYHSFRSYSQIQIWIGNDNEPLHWGWCRKDTKFVPMMSDLPAAPERLLKIIRCGCKANCDSKRCTCRKHGLVCSTGCTECQGINCTNSDTILEDDVEGTETS